MQGPAVQPLSHTHKSGACQGLGKVRMRKPAGSPLTPPVAREGPSVRQHTVVTLHTWPCRACQPSTTC
jgi:hypothetical protein